MTFYFSLFVVFSTLSFVFGVIVNKARMDLVYARNRQLKAMYDEREETLRNLTEQMSFLIESGDADEALFYETFGQLSGKLNELRRRVAGALRNPLVGRADTVEMGLLKDYMEELTEKYGQVCTDLSDLYSTQVLPAASNAHEVPTLPTINLIFKKEMSQDAE